MRSIVGMLAMIMLFAVSAAAQGSGDGKISGVVWTDFTYNIGRDSNFAALSNKALSGPRDMNGFMVRRLYFTYDKPLSGAISMRFRLEADEASNASNGKIGSFVKDAYLKWKGIFSGSDLVIGIQPVPSFEISEGVWGYRSLEKTILDLRGFVSSRDQGIALQGSLAGDDLLKYKVMYANGSGNRPETDKYKRYFGRVEVAPMKNVVATATADLAARQPLATPSGSRDNNALTYAGFVGYREKGVLSVGVEAIAQSLENGYLLTGSYLTRSAMGVSVFGSYVLRSDLIAIGRFDSFDPNTHASSKGDARTYILVGLEWKPEPAVSVIPNVQFESYESVAGVSIDPSINGRITLTYAF